MLEKWGESKGGGDALFAAGREIAADSAKHVGALLRAEAAGDFLLDFGHADIVFTLIVRKGCPGLGHEAQSLVLEVA